MQPQEQFNAELSKNMEVAREHIQQAKSLAVDARATSDDEALYFALSAQDKAEQALFLFETARVGDVVTPEADQLRQSGLERLKDFEFALNEAYERLKTDK
ncbi:hypothetical protein [Ensifer canadensis]